MSSLKNYGGKKKGLPIIIAEDWDGSPFKIVDFENLSMTGKEYTYEETDCPSTAPLKMCTSMMDSVDIGTIGIEKREDGLWITDIQTPLHIRGREILPAGRGIVQFEHIVTEYTFTFAYLDTDAKDLEELKSTVREEKIKTLL